MKATYSTLIFLSNKKTILIQLFLIPIINVLYINGVQNQINSTFSVDLAVTTVIISLIVSIILNINNSIVYESNNNIDIFIMSESKFSVYFWASKVLAIILLAYVYLILNSLLLLFLGIDTSLLIRACIVSPLYISFAIIIGVAVSLQSQKYSNPYFGINLLSVFAIILFGGLGSFTLYPPLIKMSTYAFPFSGIMHYILLGDPHYIMLDVYVAIIWVVFLFVIYKDYSKFKKEGNQSFIL